ncbi:hypothetical protein NMG60_11013941 [Bertholletia excelsa]
MAYDQTSTKNRGVWRKIGGTFRHVSSSKPTSATPSSHLLYPDQEKAETWSDEGEQTVKAQPSAHTQRKKVVKVVSGANLEGRDRVARLESGDRKLSGYIKDVKTRIGITPSSVRGDGGGARDGGGEIGRSHSSVGSVNAKVAGYLNRVKAKFRTTSTVGGRRGTHDQQEHM